MVILHYAQRCSNNSHPLYTTTTNPPLSTIFVNVHFSFFLLVSSTPKFANFVDRDMSVISPSVCTLHAIFYFIFYNILVLLISNSRSARATCLALFLLYHY